VLDRVARQGHGLSCRWRPGARDHRDGRRNLPPHRFEQRDALAGFECRRLAGRAGHDDGAHPEVDELGGQGGGGRRVQLTPVVEQGYQRDADPGEHGRGHTRKLPAGEASERLPEVVTGDPVPAREIETVRVVAMGAGVELQRVAVVALGLDPDPLQEAGRVPTTTRGLTRDEILDVQEVTPRQHVADVEPGGACRDRIALVERREEPVAGSSLHVVHAGDELHLRPDVGAQLEHRVVREMRLRRAELANAHARKHY
jgi:hypothetical protein